MNAEMLNFILAKGNTLFHTKSTTFLFDGDLPYTLEDLKNVAKDTLFKNNWGKGISCVDCKTKDAYTIVDVQRMKRPCTGFKMKGRKGRYAFGFRCRKCKKGVYMPARQNIVKRMNWIY